jgi:glycyl-tRNA synthetase beta chain
VGLGDRLDTIAGIFSVGKGPTGAADPFGLRRAALAIIAILRDRGWHVSLDRLVREAVEGVEDKRKKKSADEVETEVREFFRGRLRGVLTSQDVVPSDVAEAVLSAGYDDMVDVGGRAEALASLRKTPEFEPLAITFKRVANILKKDAPGELNRALLTEPAEQALLAAADATEGVVRAALEKRDFQAAFKAVAELRPSVDKLFDEVMVNAEDPALKGARLALVDRVQQQFGPLADFTKLS